MYSEDFIEMLSESQSMRDGHCGSDTIAKHQIELQNDNAQPVHMAPYRAGPETRKVVKSKIEEDG